MCADTKAPGPSRATRDGLKTRVRTARSRTNSSTRWLQRQLNDPYVARAKKDGYRSRAAYKLIEIDEKHRLLKPGQRLLDLGAAPGGWSQVAARSTGAATGRGGAQILAIDLLACEPMAGVRFEVMDFLDPAAPERIIAMLGGKVDGVLSDMAANTTGHKKTDQLRIIALVELAAEFAMDVLAEDGFFLAKLFQGGAEADLMGRLKRAFAKVRLVKPPASRQESSEQYLLATGFRGRPAADLPP
jgi:23S rRNA (uridine2552-2'-O)-methyltransferase